MPKCITTTCNRRWSYFRNGDETTLTWNNGMMTGFESAPCIPIQHEQGVICYYYTCADICYAVATLLRADGGCINVTLKMVQENGEWVVRSLYLDRLSGPVSYHAEHGAIAALVTLWEHTCTPQMTAQATHYASRQSAK